MRSGDWHAISDLGYIIGIILLGIGVFTLFYRERNPFFYPPEINPYKEYTFPLILAGVILFITGAVSDRRAKEEEEREQRERAEKERIERAERATKEFEKKELKFCIHCGEKIPRYSDFCSKCGEKQ